MEDDGIDLVIIVFEKLKVQLEGISRLIANCHVFQTKNCSLINVFLTLQE